MVSHVQKNSQRIGRFADFGFLLNLIIADEEKHRELINRMVSSLKDDLASTGSANLHDQKGKIAKKERALLPVVEEFLALEREGIKECERLEKASRGFQQGTFGLLCKTMIHDSLKHIGILDFLRLKLLESRHTIRKRKT